MYSVNKTLWACAILMSLLMAACSSAPSQLKVTIDGDKCSSTGPKQVPTKLSVTWSIRNATPSIVYGFAIVTLGEGKTLKDLTALIGTAVHPQPSWVTTIIIAPVGQGTSTKTYDLTANAAYHGEPIYIVCIRQPALLGAIGPIQVTQ